jgi:hypothetical protein
LVQGIWGDGTDFKRWWKDSDEEVRVAMILTALEDLPRTSSFASLVGVICPELREVHATIRYHSDLSSKTQELLSNSGKRVIDIIELLLQEKENDVSIFSFSEFWDDMGNQSSFQLTVQPMKIARSCIMLQFVTAIALVFENEVEQAAEE